MVEQRKVKYQDVYVNVTDRPTIIVGQNPGSQRKGTFDGFCWHDNKSADLLNEAIEGYDNIILTNVCQYRDMTDDHLVEGRKDFSELFNKYNPKTILLLGNFAQAEFTKLLLASFIEPKDDFLIAKTLHPSYIVRFNKDRQQYIEEIREVL